MSRSTARDLVSSALRTINAIGVSDPATDEMQNHALDELNTMLESWNTDDLIPYVRTEQTLTLVSGQAEYTIGTGGDIVDSVPNDIVQINLIVDSTEFPVEKVSNYDFYQFGKDNSTGHPNIFTYRLGYPLGTIEFYPAPNGNSARVIYNKQLSTLAISDSISLPNGYWGALQYGLAEALIPHYGISGDANALEIRRRATQMKDRLKKQNFQSRMLKTQGRGKYDILTNSYRYY